MTLECLNSMRELTSRVSNGLQVRLLWSEDDGRLFVVVNDHNTGEDFSVEVPEGESPLEVFHHPFVYASDPRGPARAYASHHSATAEISHPVRSAS